MVERPYSSVLLISRPLALCSIALVLLAGLLPGLERCGSHTSAEHRLVMSGAQPVAFPHVAHALGDTFNTEWTTINDSRSGDTDCCLFMTSCSAPCFEGSESISGTVGMDYPNTGSWLRPRLVSFSTPPESPPPKV